MHHSTAFTRLLHGFGLVLQAEQSPYLLTVLIACAGWSFTRTVEQMHNAPTIVFHQEPGFRQGRPVVIFHLKNLSTQTLFKDLLFFVKPWPGDGGTQILGAELDPVAPASILRQGGPNRYFTAKDATFDLMDFQPQASFHLVVEVSRPARLLLTYQSGPMDYESDHTAALLQPANLKTWMVDHESWLTPVLLALLAAYFALHLMTVSPNSKPGQP